MRWSRRQKEDRVREGGGKKLRSAFRWQISRTALSAEQQKWVEDLAKAYPDEKWLQTPIEKPPADATPQQWHQFYWRAWDVLRYDRQYLVNGMTGDVQILPIPFLPIDTYARRYGIEGEAFDRFLTFVSAIDDEWRVQAKKGGGL